MRPNEKATITRFLEVYNRTNHTEFDLYDLDQPIQNDATDAIIRSKNNEVLNIQIRTSDDQPWKPLVMFKWFERFGIGYEMHHKAIKRAIENKAAKYPFCEKKDIILVLDGWLGVRNEDIDEFCLTEKDCLSKTGFMEIWFVGLDVRRKMFPVASRLLQTATAIRYHENG